MKRLELINVASSSVHTSVKEEFCYRTGVECVAMGKYLDEFTNGLPDCIRDQVLVTLSDYLTDSSLFDYLKHQGMSSF